MRRRTSSHSQPPVAWFSPTGRSLTDNPERVIYEARVERGALVLGSYDAAWVCPDAREARKGGLLQSKVIS